MMTEAIERLEMARRAGHPDAMVRYIELLQCGVIRAKGCQCKERDQSSMVSACTCNETDLECERLTRQIVASLEANDELALKMSDTAKFMFSLSIEYHLDTTDEKPQASAFRRRISEDAGGLILARRGMDLMKKAGRENESEQKKRLYLRAQNYFLRGAEEDDADCLVQLAHIHAHGLGVSKNRKNALEFDNCAAKLQHPIALLELAIYYSGSDAANRHGKAPKEQVNLALSQEYFARIRGHQINSRGFAWHPLLRDYFTAEIEMAMDCMHEFEQSYPAIVQESSMLSSSSSASIAEDEAVPSAPKKRRLGATQGASSK
jgi:hypothetical protein